MPQANRHPQVPAFRVSREAGTAPTVTLTGPWTLTALARHAHALIRELEPYGRDPAVHWDLTRVEAFDSVGAGVLWQISQRRQPEHLHLQPQHRALLRRWAESRVPQGEARAPRQHPLAVLGAALRSGATHVLSLVRLVGQMVLDLGYLATHPARTPWREISATIYAAGVRALVVTAVVGLLTGMVASYLGVLSLKQFGAQTLIVNILGITTVRELGPVLTGILVAARSGSAITAQLGVMRVTQELDALSAMGTSQSLRLVLPKVIGLAIAVPLLVMWTDTVSLLGAMLIAGHTLDIGLLHLLAGLPDVVPLTNFWFGIVKGAVFGIAVALIASDYGLRTEPDTESLGQETTNSVVMTITVVILLDAALAVAFQNVGFQ